ncbi:DUF4174 domain-containing protein [uncultured Lentibacter sp.]|uniref:DUF4174 domain-containing protein n=1 Tax=uncultured Lentibacter sp. TaxID=1659309 RepID=UPI0026307D6A|nr:DUF4174 domain-containing protein [uncultured Lentibacter sp.]
MFRVLSFGIAVFFASFAWAENPRETLEADRLIAPEEADLSRFLWVNRLVIVFAEAENDPRFMEQIELLAERPQDLLARDVKIVLDSDPTANNALRTLFRPRGFMLMLVGKDGQVYLRKPLPWTVREISRSIDKLPQRQQEMRDRRDTTN